MRLRQLDKKFYFHFTNVLKLFFVLLFQLSESNPIRLNNKHHQKPPHNSIIYARVGETINISCWFDPNLAMINYRKQPQKMMMMMMANRDLPSTHEHESDYENDNRDYLFKRKRRRVRLLHKQQQKRQLLVDRTSNSVNMPTLDRDSSTSKDVGSKYFKPSSSLSQQQPTNHENNNIDDDLDDYADKSFNHNDHDDDGPEAWPSKNTDATKIVNKYELDWYFLDKNGHMNIISYGNVTSSNLKYKTFVKREEVDVGGKSNSNQMYSSSALYSQGSAARSPTSSPHNTFSSNSNNKYIYTYYLNALIESELDEGIYQCINPDLPDLILRNVTVRLAKNGCSARFNSPSALNVFSYSLLIFISARFNIFIN